MNKTIFIILLSLFLFSASGNAQVFSYKDIINQYDPFALTFNDMTIYTNDEDFREHLYAFVITTTIGNEKIIKFIFSGDIIINSVKNFDDVYWGLNISVKKNHTILFPAFFNIPNNPGSVTFKFEGYSNINELDQALMSQLSSGFVYTSSSMYNYMENVYKFIPANPDVNRPNTSLLTTSEILQQNIKTRPGVFYFGNPVEVTYAVPQDPKKVIGTNLLTQGKKIIEAKTGSKTNDVWNVMITKYTDVAIVKSEPYYIKTKGVFQDLTSQTIVPIERSAGLLSRAQEIIDQDLIIGIKPYVYINEQAARQLTNLLNLVKAGIRVKSDSTQTTGEFMYAPEREALSYFETNLKENDLTADNEYLFDDYIASSVNRGVIQKEIDLIKRYYQIK